MIARDSTIIAVVEMSQSSWLVGGVLPGSYLETEVLIEAHHLGVCFSN
jgi:hypothetical protein